MCAIAPTSSTLHCKARQLVLVRRIPRVAHLYLRLPTDAMRLVTLLLALAATSTSAQTVETPVPFDNSGRVLVVTPRLVDSLRLAAAWPVRSEFTSARL